MNIVKGNTLPPFVFDKQSLAHHFAELEVQSALSDTVGDPLSFEDVESCATAIVAQDYTDKVRAVRDGQVLEHDTRRKRNFVSYMPMRSRLPAAALALTAAVQVAPAVVPAVDWVTKPLQWAHERVSDEAAECIIVGAQPDASEIEKLLCVEAILEQPSGANIMEDYYGYPTGEVSYPEIEILEDGYRIPVLPSEPER